MWRAFWLESLINKLIYIVIIGVKKIAKNLQRVFRFWELF